MNKFSGPPLNCHATGGATIELLVVLPVLLFTLAIGADQARMMRAAVALDSAVQMGVLAGVIKLKETGFNKEDPDDPVTIPYAVIDAMRDTAENDASDYTIQVNEPIYRCRCPDADYMLDDLVPCNESSIINCSDPLIYLQMTATTQIDMVFYVPGSDPHLILSRTATMCGQ